MSESWLRFFAADADALPDSERIEKALAFVAEALPRADHIEVERYDGIRLIDCGENLTSVKCPSCRSELFPKIVSVELLATATMHSGISDRRLDLTCCGARQNLRELLYDWPIAFGRFSIDVRDPGASWYMGVPDHKREEQALLSDLSQVLATPMRALWAHY